jgi:site-specific DNA recombinase
MANKKNVTVIPQTISRFTSAPIHEKRQRKVAAYARVSTDHAEQLTSYEAQVDYYTKFITDRTDWDLAGIYTDEGISATSTAKRDGFKKMVAAAIAGEIDLIVTKSVSRFARNTVDSLQTIRKLKEHGCEVFFEKENIWTFDSKGELLISIMSSLAQEESRSISENVTWGQRKRFSDGKVSVPYSRFLGYDKGEDGTLKLNHAEAVVVRRIYAMFLEGSTPHTIAKTLTTEGIPTPGGKQVWSQTTIKGMLTNEKYKGDALLQKSYTADFLTKKQVVNKGEIPQYYVEGAHEAIIDPVVFEMVQAELANRSNGKNRHSATSLFSSRIKCGQCGNWYGAKVWHSNSKYRRTVYQCNRKFEGATKCTTPHYSEDQIKQHFITALNKLIADRDEILANLGEIKAELFDGLRLEAQRVELQSEMAVVVELIQKSMPASSSNRQTPESDRLDSILERFEDIKGKLAEVTDTIASRNSRRDKLESFIRELAAQPDLITEWHERLWVTLVDYATAHTHTDIRFTFKDGTEIAAG